MKKSKNKTAATTIALLLALTIAVTTVALPTVNAANFDTYAFLSVAPNPVGVGQSVQVNFWITPIPPQAGLVWHNYTVTITKPDGNKEAMGPFTSFQEGSYHFNYVPGTTGNYTLVFDYPGETALGNYYKPSSTPKTVLTVQQEPIPSWPAAQLPTDYWTRPINAENREWYTIAGNWLMGGYNATTKTIRSSGGFNPYTTAPRSSHIVWTREITLGGIVGGEFGDITYYTGLVYEAKMTPPVIMNGRLYYNIFSGRSPNNPTGFVCVDLRTGQELWRQNATIFCGQLYNYVSGNQMGVVPYIWSFGPTATYQMFDAFNGDLLCSFRNSRSGTVYFGPDGTLYVYVLDVTNKLLFLWNSTKALVANGLITYQNPESQAEGIGQLRIKQGTYDWSSGLQWNATITDVPGQAVAIFNGNVIVTFGGAPTPPAGETHVPQVAGSVHVAYSAKTGQHLWTQNRTFYITGGAQMCAVGEGIYAEFDVTTMRWHGMDLYTGNEVWVSDPHDYPWGSFTTNALIAYGKMYTTAYDGYVHAYDVKTGKQLWKFYSGNSGLETPYGQWPFFWDVVLVADGTVFAVTGEHSPTEPLLRGETMFAINATTGKEIWRISGFFETNAIADGYLLATNAYDNRLYCFGKGPTATTVEAPLTAITLGDSVVIRGTVTDESAGAKRKVETGEFNVVPAMSDDSMSAWMEYIYMQKPIPTNATGVTVTLDVIDANGNFRSIGTATSDTSGTFSYMWKPDIPGKYTLIATFQGSESYYASYAQTAFGVTEAPAATPTPTPAVDTTPTIIGTGIGTGIAIIIAIAIVGILLLRKK